MSENNRKTSVVQRAIRILKYFGVFSLLVALIIILHIGMKHFSTAVYQYVSHAGVWGPILFIFFQIIQVIVPILPGGVSLSVGIIAFGSTKGFLYNYLGITIGSIISFFLIRHFGRKLLKLLMSEKNYQKYIGYLDDPKKFTRFFIAAIIFPIAPDDLLCMIAGLTTMRPRVFILTIILCKPLSIYLYGFGLTALLQHFL